MTSDVFFYPRFFDTIRLLTSMYTFLVRLVLGLGLWRVKDVSK